MSEKVTIKFLEKEIETLSLVRDRAKAQRDIWAGNYDQAVGAIDAYNRLIGHMKVPSIAPVPSEPIEDPT